VDTPPKSRVAAGRARAFTAKRALGAGAVGAFALFALLARASHASNQHHRAKTGELRTPSSFVASLEQGSDDFQSGQIGAADGPPQVASGTS
jgi:hypothetical protein